MSYEKYVIEVFKDDQDCMGVGEDEIQDMIEESSIKQIERYLTKKGYDLLATNV